MTVTAWSNIVALHFMLVFMISSSIVSTARTAGLMAPAGSVRGRTSVFLVCGLATFISGALGSAPIFVSMAASAGVHDGGRTGIVSIVVGVYSLVTSLLLSTVVAGVPHCAIAPVLLLVGVSLMGEAHEVRWKDIVSALPAFFAAIFQPFTFSVAHGLHAGLGMSIILFVTTGRFILYMPRLQKRLGMDVVDHRGKFSRQETEESGGKFSRQVSGETSYGGSKTPENLPSSGVRRLLCQVGTGTRRQSEFFVDKAAGRLGFDVEEVHRIFEERLNVGRSSNYIQQALYTGRPSHHEHHEHGATDFAHSCA